MTFPTHWTRITVSGTYLDNQGNPLSGTVRFDKSPVVEVAVDGVIVTPSAIVVTLDATGSFSVLIPSTDDPDISPTGWSWHVTECVPNKGQSYYIDVPYNGGPINLASAVRVVPLTPYVIDAAQLRADLAAGSGSTLVGTQAAGVRGAVRTVFQKLSESVSIEDYTLSTDTDCTAAANAGLQILKGLGGGILKATKPSYITGNAPILVPNCCTVEGLGHDATTFTPINGANCDMFQSENFATLSGSGYNGTGTNKWLTTDGVGYAFGFVGFTISGNGSNQTKGNGIAVYGKNYLMRDVMVTLCKNDGIYTECGKSTGGTSYIEAAQSHINEVWCYNNGGSGIANYGPHDAVYDQINCAGNGTGGTGYGMECHTTAAADGNCVVVNIHTFGNATQGFYSDAVIKSGGELIFEDPASFLAASNDLNKLKIAVGSIAGDQLTLSGANTVITSVSGILHNPGGGLVQNGIRITGAGTQIGSVNLQGNNLGGFGLIVDANNVVIEGGNITSFFNSGTGRGLQISPTAVNLGLDINLNINACDYNILVSHVPVASKITIRSMSGAAHHIDPASNGGSGAPAFDMGSCSVNIIGTTIAGTTTNFTLGNAGWPGLSVNQGDANTATLVDGTLQNDIYFATTLTAGRTCTLPVPSIQNQGVLRTIVRPATGAFNVTESNSGKTVAANSWMTFRSTGAAWVESASGGL